MNKKPELNIFIENAYEEFKIDEASIYQDTIKTADFIFSDSSIIQKSCLSDYEAETVTFDIVFVNNAESHRINLEYRKKDAPADIITFAMFADSPPSEKFILDGDINLGEIIISLDKIQLNAEEKNVSFKDELYFLTAHGILHLLGFDHQNDEDYNYMVQQQKRAKASVL